MRDEECTYQRFEVTCSQCPMVKSGFGGRAIKEYENTYLIELDMNTVCKEDRHSLMRIPDFNGRVVISKKYVQAIEDEIDNSNEKLA
ncbi:Hypothetical protein ADU72_1043 [Pediococcus damnosus]|uniref:Uncharacterized protein n=1 Tax=Pediococcus damnosus TaxID=51663 RepID=A0AAC9B2L8_9LACO|nr:hypothetical protein [Pediococcus damnosus]AMV60473.1 Hypothetical protein ADU69_0808 [Pediococcus damnosus]AMV63130.1 Hypothetical protein ADU70_1652 [Pediococcus damnosus]AMV66978.1 Hypothetical protein ADU72_1043 [Pediococcus damnosus]AMV69419.1 Hypothetical protein ADU73_1015 [Pediococcus damnosus]KJU73775.1 hypothetical protein AH70_10750 [Pediococcus damnosus LMG 28219]